MMLAEAEKLGEIIKELLEADTDKIHILLAKEETFLKRIAKELTNGNGKKTVTEE